ncbi:hypothetical protein GMRT_10115 [Giardia muris]|uniref:Uncharacterized protein n=1 Tax=Giardia muris TaxID=5742 RepID=A0A4Z1SS01_GIAMU|nr:hypothetical protein GMRT_10115 [Giardia muris]|eukprot:TNJ27765.1 hypothetical protein GMRT_10115 [Giardia muris]
MDRDNVAKLRQYRKFGDLTDRDLQTLNWDARSQILATLMDGIAPGCKLCRLYYSSSQTLLPRRHQAEKGTFTYEDYQETMCRGILVEANKLGYDVSHIAPEMIRGGNPAPFNELVSLLLNNYDPNKQPPPQEERTKQKQRAQAEADTLRDHIFSAGVNPDEDADADAIAPPEEEQRKPTKSTHPKNSDSSAPKEKPTSTKTVARRKPPSQGSVPISSGALSQQFETMVRAIITDLPTEFRNSLQAIGMPYDITQDEIDGRQLLYVSARRLCFLKAQIACLELSLKTYQRALKEHRDRTEMMSTGAVQLETACRQALRRLPGDGYEGLKDDLSRVIGCCGSWAEAVEPETLDIDFTALHTRKPSPSRPDLELSLARLCADVRTMLGPVRELLRGEFGKRFEDPHNADLYEQFHAALTLLEYTAVKVIGERSDLKTSAESM